MISGSGSALHDSSSSLNLKNKKINNTVDTFDSLEVEKIKATNSFGWSKPIFIKELQTSSAELCHLRSAKEKDKLLLIGHDIKEISNIILKRLLSETAKNNTGRVLNNAFNEIFSTGL